MLEYKFFEIINGVKATHWCILYYETGETIEAEQDYTV